MGRVCTAFWEGGTSLPLTGSLGALSFWPVWHEVVGSATEQPRFSANVQESRTLRRTAHSRKAKPRVLQKTATSVGEERDHAALLDYYPR